MCVASSISMMTWCNYCLLVALRYGFHTELAKCLLFRFRSSYLSPNCERHNTSQNTTRQKWCTARKSRISYCNCLGSLEKLFLFSYGISPWLQCLGFWRYLFVGIALVAFPKTWPVGIDHCSVCDCFHSNVSKYEADLRYYLGTNLCAEKCVIAINIGLKSSNDLYTCFKCDPVS